MGKAIEHLHISLDHPDLFTPEWEDAKNPPSPAPSTLRWDLSKTELYELLVALHRSGAISTTTIINSKASLAEIVRQFSTFFNIDLADSRDVSRIISSRKRNRTPLLDRLKDTVEKLEIKPRL